MATSEGITRREEVKLRQMTGYLSDYLLFILLEFESIIAIYYVPSIRLYISLWSTYQIISPVPS